MKMTTPGNWKCDDSPVAVMKGAPITKPTNPTAAMPTGYIQGRNVLGSGVDFTLAFILDPNEKV